MKRIIFLITAVISYLWLDWRGFMQKLGERARLSNLKIPKFLFPAESISISPAHQLVEFGELSKAQEYLAAKGKLTISERKLKNRVTQTLFELGLKPVEVTEKITSKKGVKALYFLTNSLPFTTSGYTKRSQSLMEAVAENGVEIHAATRLGYPLTIGKWPKSSTYLLGGIQHHNIFPWVFSRNPAKRYEKTIELLAWLAADLGATVIHTTTNFPNAIVANRVAAKLGLPWIYEVRGELESTWLSKLPKDKQRAAGKSEYYQLAKAQETKYANAANAVVVLSEISKCQLIKRGVNSEKIFVIPNSVEQDFLYKEYDKPALRKKHGIAENSVVVGTVSSIVGYEGLDTLLRALVNLPDRYRGLIVGDGVDRPRLESLAKSLGVNSRVDFVGNQSSQTIDEWYSLLDIFVVPRKDTAVCRTVTPIKALTAQALGIPVITSDLPALREVTGGIEAYVIPEDSNDLANKILEVQPHTKGKEWAASRTWNHAAESLRSIYRMLTS
ncbi:glycosyltransferase [Corynebacterium glutamicum]|uniref:glycosyltransferase family 4 protein n=1 Tax=Corynebacterium glutamicum TaxID=1718 RepID=UPI001C6EFD80|nr:glycosyltransferase family 4 protein [Corynebacterium glutamicum]QYR17874.1 glycosyltransferase [Corynebacterium glutamicum]